MSMIEFSSWNRVMMKAITLNILYKMWLFEFKKWIKHTYFSSIIDTVYTHIVKLIWATFYLVKFCRLQETCIYYNSWIGISLKQWFWATELGLTFSSSSGNGVNHRTSGLPFCGMQTPTVGEVSNATPHTGII